MRGIRRGGTAATPASAGGSRRQWRPPLAAATALAAISLAVPLGTALATAASAAPAPRPRPAPAPRPKAAPAPRPDFAPSGAVVGASRYIFFNWGDGAVYRKTMTARGPVRGVTSVGGHIVGGPSAIRLGQTRTALVFGQGRDGALWMNFCTARGCGAKWTFLGGRITSKPGAVDDNRSNYSVYARGADGAVWALDHTGRGWGRWHSIGGKVLAGTAPSAAIHDGSFVLVAGTNRGLYLAHAGRHGFHPVGGRTTASPALVSTTKALVGFARGTDNAAYYQQFMRSSPGWHWMGRGILASGVGGAASGNSTWTCTMGADGQVYELSGSWDRYPPTFSGWGPRTP